MQQQGGVGEKEIKTKKNEQIEYSICKIVRTIV